MKIPRNIADLLNTQFKAEYEAAYLYLSMANYLYLSGYDGFARRLRLQAKEEQTHAMKIFDYMIARGESPYLDTIAAPLAEWASLTAVFEAVYAHECLVTTLIYTLYEKASDAKDFGTVSFIQWYVNEQIEEENQSLTLLTRIKSAQDSPAALLELDAQCGKRNKCSACGGTPYSEASSE